MNLLHPSDREWVPQALKMARGPASRTDSLPDHPPRWTDPRRQARGEEENGKRVGSVMDITERAQVERALSDARRIARPADGNSTPKPGDAGGRSRCTTSWVSILQPSLDGEAAFLALVHPDDRAAVEQA